MKYRTISRLLFILVVLMYSCKVIKIEYPQFYHSTDKIERHNSFSIYEYKFSQNADNKILEIIYDIAERSSSEYLIFDVSNLSDTIRIRVQGTGISMLENYNPTKDLGLITYQCQDGLVQQKKLVFYRNSDNLRLVEQTKRRYQFVPYFIRLSNEQSIITYDRITNFEGCFIGDSMHIKEYIIDNKTVKE